MSARLRAAGVVVTTSGALLVVALLLDWWDYPGAFDRPADLPPAAAFAAEAASGLDVDADAFTVFNGRALLWLGSGIVAFACGLVMLVAPRLAVVAAAIAGSLALVAGGVIAWTLISPPDFADPAPGGDPFDFGVDLPLSRDLGGYVALAAAIGAALGAGAALVAARGEPDVADADAS